MTTSRLQKLLASFRKFPFRRSWKEAEAPRAGLVAEQKIVSSLSSDEEIDTTELSPHDLKHFSCWLRRIERITSSQIRGGLNGSHFSFSRRSRGNLLKPTGSETPSMEMLSRSGTALSDSNFTGALHCWLETVVVLTHETSDSWLTID